MTETTEQKLNRLAEFYSQKDSLDAQKRALLDEVKVPAEVLEVQEKANAETQKAAAFQRALVAILRAECDAKLAEIQIPDHVKAVIDAIDRDRALVHAYQLAKEAEFQETADKRRAELFAQAQAQTAQVYADLEQRKRDISAEFAGKLEAVDDNIKALEAEIKKDVIEEAAKKIKYNPNAKDLSVKGDYFHAVYTRGRVTWKTDNLDGLELRFREVLNAINAYVMLSEELNPIKKSIVEISEIVSDARKEGDPSVALRRI